ncbi:NAD(P)H-dependent FMN reductase [Haloactinospora alba]|uniref:NAD(P)H-dependent FMN reductase n=1 Tax=Haloactinospora alba TaxID=405555 RepID=A0A543N9M3_9ACTN|nr:NAD(P)H-dependent oxidoreductase [Haloactinospora alba]TQN28500.1 NAD(P)H-dependent FMN reductase [Haloactinospora alba]
MTDTPLNTAVLVGSTRENRFAPNPAAWFVDHAKQRDDLALDVIDLAETPLPTVQQAHPVYTGHYPSPDVRAFASRIAAADAFVVAAAEYNHSFPAPLKLAIDSVHPEWRAKPVGFVSYGGLAGGLRSVEQLRLVFAELHAVTMRDTVSFPNYWKEFDADGNPTNPDGVAAAATTMLNQLVWWGTTLRDAKRDHPYDV